MKLIKLELSNFCQHASRSIDFTRGLTGILGANGSGKSNLIQALIYAITGTTANNLERYIRQGSDGNTWVKLTFYSDLNDKEYVIKRSIKPRKAELLCSDGLAIRKAKDVDAYLTDVLKLDFNIIRNVLAVNQEDFVAFLRATASERAAMLMRLFGFIEFKTARESFRQVLLEASSETDYSAELKAKRELLATELRALEPFKDAPNRDDLQREYDTFCTQANTVRSYSNLYSTRDYFARQKADIRRDAEKLNKKLAELGEIVPSAGMLDHQKQLQVKLQSVEYQLDSCEKLYNKLVQALGRRKAYDAAVLEWKALQQNCLSSDEEERLFARHKFLQGTITNMESCVATGCCPTCGQAFPNLHEKLEQARKEFAEVDVQYQRQFELHSKADSKKYEVGQLERSYKDAFDDIAHYAATMSTVTAISNTTACANNYYKALINNPIKPFSDWLDVDLTPWSEEIHAVDAFLVENRDFYKGKIAEIESNLKPIKEREDLWHSYQMQLQVYLNQLNDLDANTPIIPEGALTMEQIKEFNETYDKTQSEFIRLFEIVSRVDAINTRILNLKNSIAELESLAVADESRIKYAESVREAYEVLHPDALPKVVMTGLLEMLATNINSHLSLFEAPFTVSINPDSTELICTFSNGETFVASELSGGQKMVLAISWRLALHNTFSSEESCGFITLDEPTNHLDSTNIQNLAQVMQQVKQAARDRNLQVLVITHEKTMEPLFDSLIRL